MSILVYVVTGLVTIMAIFVLVLASGLLPFLAYGSGIAVNPMGLEDRGNMTANNETSMGQGENISSASPMKLDGLILNCPPC